MFQAPITDAAGRLESFAQVAYIPTRRAAVPRQRRATAAARACVAARSRTGTSSTPTIFRYLNLSLDDHALHVYGHDGNPRRSLLSVGSRRSRTGVVLAPGNRASVLVQAGAPGTYYLRTLSFQMGGAGATLPEDVLAEIVVVDEARPMALPAGPLPVPASLAPITDEELASAGGLRRHIVMRAVFAPATADQPPGSVVHPGGEVDDWFYQSATTNLSKTVFALGAASGQASTAPGMPTEFIPYQSSRALKQTVALGSVEEWTVFNMNNVPHPFHLHVNPFQVIRINGEPVDPYWADTIALPPNGSPVNPTSVTFRTRFRDFSGTFVMHCHMLAHEDMGMMQMVEVV